MLSVVLHCMLKYTSLCLKIELYGDVVVSPGLIPAESFLCGV